MGEHHGRLCIPLLVELDRGGQIEISQHIPTDDHEALIQEVLRITDTSGGTVVCLSPQILELHPKLAPVVEIPGDDIGLVVECGHQICDSVPLQQFDDVLHHRSVQHGDHRLGNVAGKRSQAGSKPPSHDNGFHRRAIDRMMIELR